MGLLLLPEIFLHEGIKRVCVWVSSYGHPAIVKTNKKFLFQRHIAYLKPIPTTINSIYLHRAILSDNVQRKIDERVKGIAQKTLNLSEIRKIVIPAPPLELQTQFANFVKQVDQSKSILQQELTQTQTGRNPAGTTF